MAEATSDNLYVNIGDMLDSWFSSPLESSIFRVGKYFPSIFEVDDHLRNIKPDAYDPKIIAIGPFHRNKPHLMKMEQLKVWYLKRLLERNNQTFEIYVEEISCWKKDAWECYGGEIGLGENEFLQMLLLDGCFIIEFLRKFQYAECRDWDDPIFQYEHIQNQLMHDLMLFENQIPFFVIDCLFNISQGDSRYNVVNSIIGPLLQNGIFLVQDPPPKLPESPHLLGIVYDIQCCSFAEKLSQSTDRKYGSNEDGMCWLFAGKSENGTSADVRNNCSSSAKKSSSQTDPKNGSNDAMRKISDCFSPTPNQRMTTGETSVGLLQGSHLKPDRGNGTNDETRNECWSSTEKASQSHLKLDPGNSTNNDEIRNECWSSDQTDPELNDSSADAKSQRSATQGKNTVSSERRRVKRFVPHTIGPFLAKGEESGNGTNDIDSATEPPVKKMLEMTTRRLLPVGEELPTRGTTSSDKVNIDSATELEEFGISFKRSKVTSLFHIEFNNKAMSIPVWKISDSTESSFRNLIAYEYYQRGNPRKYVTDYVLFMHCLVHSPEDAKLLRRHGIISSLLGGDEMVYQVINNLGKDIIASEEFSYSGVFSQVNHHCELKRNKWMATLRREYFSSPWASISVLAAITLLMLTVTQTMFGIFSYRNDLN